uniref:Serpentine receptor class gamma n=1 Tax=Panagrellus redivivus TaxID=6233 RepID=A0A7E4ULB9_PANRE
MLTMLVASWWLCAIFGTFLAGHYIAFWRPDPIYNKYALLVFFIPAMSSINCVHISQFFLTLERIIIMKSTNAKYYCKKLLALCIFFNTSLAVFLGTLFVANFDPNGANNDSNQESRMPVLSIIDKKTYLILYYISNGISAVTLLASLYFLIVFRKSTKATEMFTKMEKTIKYTIWVDIWFDFLPQIFTVGLTMVSV